MPTKSGRRLEDMSWPDAEQALRTFPALLLPLGAACKQHGPHLPLNTDALQADYLCTRLLALRPLLALPTLRYGYYPAFVEYPGSISLQRDTQRDTIIQIATALARHGGRRLYVLNTGISTNHALEPARLALAEQGIDMDYFDLLAIADSDVRPRPRQPRGSHADELETSTLLYIAPDKVQLQRAKPELAERRGPGPFRRDPTATDGIPSPSGSWGDPTLANADKGREHVQWWLNRLLTEIDTFLAPDWHAAPARRRYLD